MQMSSNFDDLRELARELLATATLEKGIEQEVITLLNAGIKTFESCEGGSNHAYAEPTIRFHGDRSVRTLHCSFNSR
jgi:hypothetical protein